MKVKKSDGRVVEEFWITQDTANDPAGQAMAGKLSQSIRERIVRGFFCVKNPKESEEKVREMYKVPESWKATWNQDGSVTFAYSNNKIQVTPDGRATKLEGEK